jgi:hypothetical protein
MDVCENRKRKKGLKDRIFTNPMPLRERMKEEKRKRSREMYERNSREGE